MTSLCRKSSSRPYSTHFSCALSYRMNLRDFIYGYFFRVINNSRLGITPRSPSPPELRCCPLERSHIAYQRISLRLSHGTAEAAQGKERDERYRAHADLIRHIKSDIKVVNRVKSDAPKITPSIRFITFDQAQHDLEKESGEDGKRERYADQIAKLLAIKPTAQANAGRSKRGSLGIHKADKLHINKLLKDKGQQTRDWRIAYSDLTRYTVLEYSVTEKINRSKDIKTLVYPPRLFPIDSYQIQDLEGSNDDQDPVRRVVSESRNYRSFRLARHISSPTEWSEASLAVNVEALAYSQRIQARVPWVQRPRWKVWTNIEDVVTAFDTIFYSTFFQKFLTVKACNTALGFFYDHGMMTKARDLYQRMEDLKMNILTDTFNILLRGSASQRDLHNFTFLLNNMTRRGFAPNEMTWLLFLRVVDSSEGRATIARKMAQKNMLDNTTIRRKFASEMIPDEIATHLGNGHDHHSFLDRMDNKYGVGWLSTTAGNVLLNEIAKHLSTAESLSLLYEMKHAGFMPDDISMNTLLTHCLPLEQFDLAFEILAEFKKLYGLYPGSQVYETLFRHAWRLHLLNLCIVIWRTACIYGAVSRRMRSQVFQSLLFYTPALDKAMHSDDAAEFSNMGRTAKFGVFAGRFVIRLDRPGGVALSQAMDSLHLSPGQKTRRWAQSLLEISFRIARTCHLDDDLSHKLREALAMDKSWAVKGLYEKDDWRELFPHAITVPVRVNRWCKVRRKRRPVRFRKHRDQGRSATSLIMRRKDVLKDADGQKSNRLRLASPTRMKNRRLKRLRNVDLRMKEQSKD